MPNWNTKIIEEFRANRGEVASFTGRPLLLLHHRGAKSGIERVSPLAKVEYDGGYVVIASKGGAPDNPDWYHNLLAHPEVEVELGTETIEARARVLEGDEREAAWKRVVTERPTFADYQEKTEREIPLILLEPK